MSLTDANWAPQAAAMLHDEEIPDEKKAELKAVFVEGLVRFLDIYSQTEIGEGVEIDIAKVALHINSPSFENDDLYAIRSVEDVYKLCEELAIAGLPLWRFLRLTDYQSRLFESGYSELLISAKKKAASERPCYGCIWYKETDTFLGTLRECRKPETEASFERKVAHDPEVIRRCRWLTTLDTIPKAAYDLPEDSIGTRNRKQKFFSAVEPARKRFLRELAKDPFRIPKTLSKEELVDLNTAYDPVSDLVFAFRNKRTQSERQAELRRAMYVEGMVRFFETYAQCELGSGYVADIKNIALYANELETCELSGIGSFDDVYADLENKILKGFDVKRYVKYGEEWECVAGI